tara:strand:+ start:55 stop:285 length:231 start_codon:yes stop_codon:yes gene_type:complete
MATISNYEIELDGVALDVHGYYIEGDSGDYFGSPEPDEFEVECVFALSGDVSIDVTDLIYYRIQELEEFIIEKYYR